MAYKALYRTYRPATFDEIAGQEHITKTFRNALKNNKIAHAYLFSGPRGTGKTSIAKIIAKAVNCEQAPAENPCNECDICRGIENNSISDVIEIDAASNNGVDEIREIRDKVKYLPGVGKYKVYIIDEVHMLSIGAF
ncbi:MAG: AAA family ATPase, partial [Candidatus Izimaplasma sp.]|nr:AAA family ATPase [Candidatus Izimaplasma bacterium]